MRRVKDEHDAEIRRIMGMRMRAARCNIGLVLEDVAIKLGVKRQTVSRWECGIIAISAEKIPTLCTLLQISPNDLFGFNKGERDAR